MLDLESGNHSSSNNSSAGKIIIVSANTALSPVSVMLWSAILSWLFNIEADISTGQRRPGAAQPAKVVWASLYNLHWNADPRPGTWTLKWNRENVTHYQTNSVWIAIVKWDKQSKWKIKSTFFNFGCNHPPSLTRSNFFHLQLQTSRRVQKIPLVHSRDESKPVVTILKSQLTWSEDKS